MEQKKETKEMHYKIAVKLLGLMLKDYYCRRNIKKSML